MFKKITNSFLLAFHNIRSHFFHTILSLLGIVIGVAALVSILSLIDGMERYAQDQISNTTSLKSIFIWSEQNKIVDGVSVRRDSIDVVNYKDFKNLKSSISKPAKGYLFHRQARQIFYDTVKSAGYVNGTISLDTMATIVHGRKFSDVDLDGNSAVAVLTEAMAKSLAKNSSIESLLGKEVSINDLQLTIVGIIRSPRSEGPELYHPITLLSHSQLQSSPPQLMIEADHVTDVETLKKEVDQWLTKHYQTNTGFRIVTNELRVKQAAQGFFLFRIIMGMIVGISVIVGGIGVMNVLLISVTERTSEIGVRKAVGATRRDIVLQFLSESITISLLGSFVGLVFGVLATMIIIPIIRSLTGAPFQAAFTWNTLAVISILALVVGVVFGTYPAIRASKLDPVEAIRRE